MKIDLTGQTALVTGAGRGIGEACARALADSGALVWVNDINPAEAAATASRIGGLPLPGDVAEPGDWLCPVLERGVLHALIHNAGYDLDTPVGQTDRTAFDRLLKVQLSGPFEITQRLLEPLKQAQGAAVIHIASVHARATNPAMAAYAASKGGQVAMVNSLAQDLGPHQIRALAVSPGFIDTSLLDDWVNASNDPAALRASVDALHPLGRVGTPEDIGNLIVFLASPLARFINATNIVIDGGLTTRLF